jgi:alpha-glucosidase
MRYAILFSLTVLYLQFSFTNDLTIQSPDHRLRATVRIGKDIGITLVDSSTSLFRLSSISLAVRGVGVLGTDPDILEIRRWSRDTVLVPPIREKCARLRDRYNTLVLRCRGGYSLEIRLYDEGFAYRFLTSLPGNIVVERESLRISLPDSARATYQFNTEFWSAYETPYRTSRVKEIPEEGICNLPILLDPGGGRKIVMTEADISDYPGLWLKHTTGARLEAVFPGYPLAFLDEGKTYTRGKVTSYAADIARTSGNRGYPWRVFVVARSDAELLTNALVYLLGRPTRIGDVSWVTPGVVTLDWWARRNLFGVDFPGGVNTATANYMIDFAAHYGIEYFLLDEGWTKPDDLLTVHPDLDLEAVLAYARSRGVRVLLWAVWSTLERQWDAAFARFSRWGISGIKVDFMNRDDQVMVGFYHRVAEETARRKMLAIFHGAYKPDGLRRTYPNVITREGVLEFEQNAVNADDSPEHHTLLPFIRMVAGPMDYLPGTMRNAQKHEFRMTPDRPMGQGTRAHTMALCVLFESPMRMLPDSPPDYCREDECTKFMADTPVEWDELRVLEARLGDYVALARRHGRDWYVAAVTDWDPRDMTVDLSFLDKGTTYSLTSFSDGKNAVRRGSDYRRSVSTVRAEEHIPISLAPGGGWVARLSPVP